MRLEASVTSVSWIPSELITGMPRLAFDLGITAYDDPLPDQLGDLDQWRHDARFRFANRLQGWIEVDDDGGVTEAGYGGGGLMGRTKVKVGRRLTFSAIALPDLREPPVVDGSHARFVQTTGGWPPLPAPRRVDRAPHWLLTPPVVWTTLALTVRADGTSEYEVLGASPFPRHWVYDDGGALAAKVGVTDFDAWYRSASFKSASPWGAENSPAIVTAAETALERQVSTTIMRGGVRPEIRYLSAGAALCRQGDPGDEIYLLLDGVVAIDVDGRPIAEVGPGAVLGERAVLEGGRRTSTVMAVTPVRVAVTTKDGIDPDALHELAEGHRRELL